MYDEYLESKKMNFDSKVIKDAVKLKEDKMKNTRKILIALFFFIIVVSLPACNNEANKVREIALVVDSNLEKIKEAGKELEKDFQEPMNLQIGEIAYVRDIYERFAYVILLRPMEPTGVDSVGYIPLDNLKFDYTPEEMEEKSIYCHIIKDNIPIYNEPNGKQIGTIDSQYTMIEKRQESWVLVSQKGGAESGWINGENVDYDFLKFVEDVKNKEYDFEKQIQ